MSSLVTTNTDLIIDIFQSGAADNIVGSLSIFSEQEHPGTNKKIEGFKWDKRTWPTLAELEAVEFVPNPWDPSTALLDKSDFQTGIGDNEDLLLFDIKERVEGNLPEWLPRVNHGFFFISDVEWFLFSDDYVAEHINFTPLTASGLQFLDLQFDPKPTIPIKVRRYRFDKIKQEYLIDRDFKKKVELTGLTVSGVEQSTVDSDGFLVTGVINRNLDEFIVDHDFGDTPRLTINKDISEEVGGQIVIDGLGFADSGTVLNLERIGIGDSVTSEFNSIFSPIDPSGEIQLVTYTNPDKPIEWTQISSVAQFTSGPNREFKVDHHLGVISFGDFDVDTTSGAGVLPAPGEFIGLRYTKGLLAEYEPVNSRDWLLGKLSDTNPLHSVTDKGFVRLSTTRLEPSSIKLDADLVGSVIDGFTINLGNLPGKLIATIKDRDGNVLEGQDVTFELIKPIKGTLGSSDNTSSSISDLEGEAVSFFTPPITIEDLGVATDTVTQSGAAGTTITFPGLNPPDSAADVVLFRVLKYDPATAIAASGIEQFYTEFFEEEQIDVDPDTTPATSTFEVTRRTIHGLEVPSTYDETDDTTLDVGAKVIILTLDPNAIDPNLGFAHSGVLAPITAEDIENVGTEEDPIMNVTYTGLLPSPSPTNDFKAYFGVAEATTKARAFITTRTGRKIFSNVIDLNITIPPEADGTFFADTLNDVQSGLIKRATDIDNVTDDEIIAKSGELSTTYFEERCVLTSVVTQQEFEVEDDTLALWHMNDPSSLVDSGPLGFDLVNSGTTQVAGRTGEAFEVADRLDFMNTTSGIQDGFQVHTTQAIDWEKGTIEMHYRTPEPDYTLVSGGGDQAFFFAYRGQGDPPDNLFNTLTLGAINNPGFDGRALFILFQTSGIAASTDPDSPSSFPFVSLDNLSTPNLEDGEFHQIKLTWAFSGITTKTNDTSSGLLDINMYIDDVPVIQAPNMLMPRENVSSGIFSTAVGLLPVGAFGASVSGVFDEIRLSSTVHDFDTVLPTKYDQTYESFTEWFRRARRADSEVLTLEDVLISGVDLPGRIPLGFRLQSPGITIASLLDRITYLDPNDYLVSGYLASGEC